MSSKLDDILGGIKTNLAAAFPTVQVTPYLNPRPQPPCIDMMPSGVEYDMAMGRSSDRYEVTVRLMVPWNDPVAAQANLNAFCDPTGSSSVKTAIEADRTLGGKVAWCRVTSMSGLKEYPHRQAQTADIQLRVGVEFEVEAMT